MRTLSIDIETFSSVDLAKSGVYRYAEAPDFEILLFGYSVDAGPVQVVDFACGEKIPKEIQQAILDNNVTKWAFNAQFERICLSKYFGIHLAPDSWRCTMVWSAYLGLPLSLEGAAIVTGADKKKLTKGKELIRYFSVPCKPTVTNGGRTRNLPEHAPEKWNSFKAYNLRDVEVELSIQEKLQKFPMPEEEWNNYILDQQINDRGIQLDLELVKKAIQCDEKVREELTSRLKELTDLDNPNSVVQMKSWLSEKGLETDSLDKASVKALLKEAPEHLSEVLELRQLLAKSSVKKYTAMENAVCTDGRARGLLQFYGANRTGRFAGRLIQVQNLPQNHLSDLEQARRLVRGGHFDALEILYDSIPGVLSELIRTAFVPKKGYKFIVADFSAIEARVIAWLAGETWRNEVFATHGKIYEASASQMFKVPLEEVTKGSPLRQKGKIAELALGYGGSVGALKAMGALDMGLTEEELKPLVYAWRNANPNIVRLWLDVDRAVKEAVTERCRTETHRIRFEYRSGMLLIWLPSGRQLTYVKPRMGINSFGSEAVTYEGVGATKKWERIESYGPKFVENIVQAISRDILCCAMRKLNEKGFDIVMHVHDEVVLEVPLEVTVTDICTLMNQTPTWAQGLLLRADGYECNFYKKD
ncbi:DNA polymerase [Clostridioides difficile]|jgi:DNA polymerase|uniref:DNA-directed DNA polymerase n=1 Tax=Staphylococcus aureus TaxID=1280 RepID=A0A380EJW3_STAAU|nr:MULTISPECIES: DNA polymerase [Bacillota]MBY1384250.1 DNA polymerase [Clostridioides difficile]KFL08113.1 DNA polymerase A family protein [Staphylococcus aureus]MCR1684890.1 DNA polymerase [Clostridioides difficile]SUL36910.1 DNA polymerase [Staphylococcus aureus]SUL55497.1 DNA polymerase [Staphylococcus aureus]